MLNITTIPARNLQKSYKSILGEVKKKRLPVILTTNNKPQAAIVSLEDLANIQEAKKKKGSLDILGLAIENKEELKSLPFDLRKKANQILYI